MLKNAPSTAKNPMHVILTTKTDITCKDIIQLINCNTNLMIVLNNSVTNKYLMS